MDGLTVSNSNALLETGKTLKEIRDSKVAIPNPSAKETGQKSFADTLKDVVQNVNMQQQESDKQIQELALGKRKDVAEVMITAEKADISLKLMTSVRNKIIEAYQEIMKMQV
jgi:flagellar hook-basal body complex protein FliE